MKRSVPVILLVFLLGGCSYTAMQMSPEEIEKKIAELPPEQRDLEAHAAGSVSADMARATERQKQESAKLEAKRAEAVRQKGDEFDPVVVTDKHVIDGIWRLTGPTKIELDFGGEARYEDVGDIYCRVDKSGRESTMYCIGRDSADGEIEQTGAHISWTNYMFGHLAALTLEGDLVSPTAFKGEYRARALAMSIRGVPIIGQKVVPTDQDRAGEGQKVASLLADLQAPDSKAPVSKTEKDWRDDFSLSRSDLRKLGKVTQVAYVDRYDRPTHEDPVFRRPRDVYSVDFENGWKLCVILRNEAGEVALFNCH